MHYSVKDLMKLLKSVGAFFLFFLLAAILIFEIYAVVVVFIEGDVLLPPTFGNFESVRSLLDDDQGDEFSFAIVGDTKGCGTFERIYEGLKTEPLSFMVILGDCVRKPTDGNHQYFRVELAEEFTPPFPVFYIIGNHDVDNEKFPISKFEKTYGPSNFSFEYKKNLFIFLRILPPPYSTEESISYLESVLSEKRDDNKRVFVFMHVPPPISKDYDTKDFEHSDELAKTLDKYNVDYVCAGDFHGYARVKKNNTVYLISGGGGANLRKVKYGKFHHAVVLHVRKDSVSERVLYINRSEDFEDRIELIAFADINPFFKDHKAATLLINIAIISILFLLSRKFIFKRGMSV